MLKSHEILGTDKPIFQKKEEYHFFIDEITEINENPEDYFVSGYVPVIKNKEVFFKAVYSFDLSNFKVVQLKHEISYLNQVRGNIHER